MSTPAVIAEGLGFTEGPLWTAAGSLWVVGLSRGVIYELRPGGQPRIRAETGGNPSGLCQAADGVVWIAQGGTHRQNRSHRIAVPSIQRVIHETVEDVVTSGLDAPNDCAIGPDGLLWFTDPRGEAMTDSGPPGRVCTLDAITREVTTRATGIRYPNGIAFADGGSALYIAETGTARVLRYACDESGMRFDAVFAELPKGRPDGLALDCDGRLYVAATDSHTVQVFGPDGDPGEVIDLGPGSFPTNLCFGGADLRTLFVTTVGRGRVYAVRRETAGMPLGNGQST